MPYKMNPLTPGRGLFAATVSAGPVQLPMSLGYPGQKTNQTWRPHTTNAPTNNLPGLLGRMSCNLTYGGLDSAIAGTQLPAFASLLVQSLADIAWPNGQHASIGFSAYLQVASSAGKSVPYKQLRDPIDREVRAWTLGNAEKKIAPALFAEDITREGLILHLREWKWVGLFSDDAGQCKQLVKAASPTLAKLNDGDDINHARVKDGRIALTGHRFNMLLAEQPGIDGVGHQLLAGSNAGVGLVNRLFVAQACSAQIPKAFHGVTFSNEVREAYEKRVKTLIEASIKQVTSGLDRPVLRLSKDASEFLIASGEELRNRYWGHSRGQTLNAYVARHSERILRLAGVLHVFEFGTDGEIQLDVMQAADVIGRWSIEQYERMTDVPVKPSQAEVDVQRLGEALHRHCAVTGSWAHELTSVRRQSFNVGLSKARFDRALAELCGQGRVSIFLQGRKDLLCVHQPLSLGH
ncbi:DUF3987 domain-containing protein [Paucibacter sp. AS339]|uniref:DUF3987 domain-containing protein n=1 Tax=Paucibacter hankyongi TaxID=3133434 RepID=UPI0030B157E7